MQRTQVQSLVWEDPTCHGATKPPAAQLLKPTGLEQQRKPCNKKPTTTTKSSSCSPQLQKTHAAMKTHHSQTEMCVGVYKYRATAQNNDVSMAEFKAAKKEI